MKAEHQKHLGGPPAETLDRDEPFDDRLVGQRLELVELRRPSTMRAHKSRK